MKPSLAAYQNCPTHLQGGLLDNYPTQMLCLLPRDSQLQGNHTRNEGKTFAPPKNGEEKSAAIYGEADFRLHRK